MAPPKVDYSVYLVTDSTPAILGAGRTVEQVVQAALTSRQACGEHGTETKSSVGIVQLRDKQADARKLLATLAALHEHTAAAGVPLVLNDRVDVAAVAMARGHCEGVHLGQDDIDIASAREILGPDAIIGVTASTPEEAIQACLDGADYLGLGTVYATPTKTNTKHVVGPLGVRRMLAAIATANFSHVPTVCIGGIHAGNARRVIFQGSFLVTGLEDSPPPLGVAVVSAIMSAPDPAAAATALAEAVRLGNTGGPTDFYRHPPFGYDKSPVEAIQPILAAMHRCTPLSHNMTNLVVQNFAANVALAIGASPIMSNNGAEAADLARLPFSALVVNMGTVTPEGLANYVTAIGAYNAAGRPVIFDPVGAGATTARRAAVRTILSSGYIDVIKGNEGEIQALLEAGEDEGDGREFVQQRGVDGSNRLGPEARAHLAQRLAIRQRCVVVLTGPVDYISDLTGNRVVAVAHGHPLLSQITGTGCTLGTTISATVAAAGLLRAQGGSYADAAVMPDTFAAAVAAAVLFERAAELAAESDTVAGPGTFVPAFLDCLSSCRKLAAEDDMAWIGDDYKIETVGSSY